jgi:hypothetical protein
MQSIVFEKIFYNGDYEYLRSIFNDVKQQSGITGNYDYMLNAIFNAVIITYLQETILNNIAELFSGITNDTETKNEIWTIYSKLIAGNSDSIICEDFDNFFDTAELDHRARLVVDHELVLKNYSEYFKKVRQEIFDNALKSFNGVCDELCEHYISALSEVHTHILALSALSNSDTLDYEKCEQICRENNCIKALDLVLIIEYMTMYKFNEEKFRKKYKHWMLNKSLSIIDFQTQYLLSIIPKNKSYNIARKNMLECINSYTNQINKIKKKNESDKNYIKDIYSKVTSGINIDDEIIALI